MNMARVYKIKVAMGHFDNASEFDKSLVKFLNSYYSTYIASTEYTMFHTQSNYSLLRVKKIKNTQYYHLSIGNLVYEYFNSLYDLSYSDLKILLIKFFYKHFNINLLHIIIEI